MADEITTLPAASIAELREQAVDFRELRDFLRDAPCEPGPQEQWFSERLSDVAALTKTVEERRTSITKPLLESKRSIDALFKPLTDPLKEADTIIREKLRSAARKRLQAEREALAKAQAALTAGLVDESDAALDTIPEFLETSGSTSQRTWAWKVADFSALSDTFKTVDTSAIDAAIRAHTRTGSTEPPVIPGLVFDLDATIRRRPT